MNSRSKPASNRAKRMSEEAWNLRNSDPVRALELARTALDDARHYGDSYASARSLQTIGTALYLKSQLTEALDYLHQALELYRALELSTHIATVLRQTGAIYLDLDAPEEALPRLLQALSLAETAGDGKEQTACLVNIAKAHSMQGDTERAMEIYRDAEAVAVRMGELHTASIIYRNLGVNACRLRKYKDALYYLRKALSLHHRTGNRMLIASMLEAIGSVFAQTNSPRKALRYYRTALRIQREVGVDFQTAVTLSNIGATLEQLGQSEAALETTLEGLALAERSGAKEFALDMHRQCADISEKLGDTESANHHLRAALNLATELSEEKRLHTIAMYQVRFDMQRSKAQQQELLMRLREAEQAALRSQMNPHFISNALSAIQSLVMEGEADEAQRYLSRFARLIRRLFEQTRTSYIPLENELETLQLYLEMEKLRYESRFNFAIAIVPPLGVAQCFVPPLILQPLAENALLHGILPSNHSGLLEITAQLDGTTSLRCTVADNGIGLRAAAAQPRRYVEGSSLGLTVVRERLALVEESTGKKAAFHIEERATGGTVAKVVLPVLGVGDV